MFDLDGIWSSDKKMKIATGLSLAEANFVMEDFGTELKKIRRLKHDSKVGRPAKLDPKTIFLMTMVFIRHYNTYEFMGLIFGVDVSTVKRWVDDASLALGELLVKKNFAHLLAVDQERLSKTDLSSSQRSLLMELNSLSGVQKTN